MNSLSLFLSWDIHTSSLGHVVRPSDSWTYASSHQPQALGLGLDIPLAFLVFQLADSRS